jgi:DNA-binding GntR family transcriptional regulator
MECSGNNKLVQTYINSHIPLFHQRLTKSNSSENDYELTDKEHRAIVKALKEKKIEEAERVMKLHFARGAVLIDADFDQQLQ